MPTKVTKRVGKERVQYTQNVNPQSNRGMSIKDLEEYYKGEPGQVAAYVELNAQKLSLPEKL